jgi:hypothetical protein
MLGFGSKTVTRRNHLAFLASASLCAGALSISGGAVAAGLSAVQYNYSVTFAAGATSASKTITPATPAGKVLVIQTISIYRYPASTSTLQTFVGVGGGYFALADITGTGTTSYPAATTNLTSYVAAGQSAYVNMYRTGSPLNAETAYITISGYLTAN